MGMQFKLVGKTIRMGAARSNVRDKAGLERGETDAPKIQPHSTIPHPPPDPPPPFPPSLAGRHQRVCVVGDLQIRPVVPRDVAALQPAARAAAVDAHPRVRSLVDAGGVGDGGLLIGRHERAFALPASHYAGETSGIPTVVGESGA